MNSTTSKLKVETYINPLYIDYVGEGYILIGVGLFVAF